MTKKILIVDDEPEIRELILSRIQPNGYEIISAPDGQEGLQKAEAEVPDLIISDVMMPNMDGYTFLQELRKSEKCRNIPVIILTVKEKMEGLFKAEGITEYVLKPIDAEQLLSKVKQLLEPRT